MDSKENNGLTPAQEFEIEKLTREVGTMDHQTCQETLIELFALMMRQRNVFKTALKQEIGKDFDSIGFNRNRSKDTTNE